jgi:hypothetical protein
MDAQDTDSLLDQAMALAAGRSRSAVFGLFDMNNVVNASTLHEYTVGAYETTAQDFDALSQADTEACRRDSTDID